MTIRLTIQREAWRQHVEETIASTAHPVPVVKGNGYGLGRARLAGIAADLADTLAVGTVRELNDLPTTIRPVVLTPTLEIPPTDEAILTVGAVEHIAALTGWGGEVLVKLESSMHRYGGGIELIDTARAAGLRVLGVSIHPPLAGTNEEHLAEIAAHADRLDDDLEIWISHVDPSAVDRLP
ncbi:MAG: alanine racemase, partial [Actinomycetota bacterium]|nr:alanine racemase [Actinomycetota bacterium]